MGIFGPTDMLNKSTKFFAQCGQNLVLILDRFYPTLARVAWMMRHCGLTVEKWNKLVARAFRAQRKCDCGKTMYGIEPQQHIVML